MNCYVCLIYTMLCYTSSCLSGCRGDLVGPPYNPNQSIAAFKPGTPNLLVTYRINVCLILSTRPKKLEIISFFNFMYEWNGILTPGLKCLIIVSMYDNASFSTGVMKFSGKQCKKQGFFMGQLLKNHWFFFHRELSCVKKINGFLRVYPWKKACLLHFLPMNLII